MHCKSTSHHAFLGALILITLAVPVGGCSLPGASLQTQAIEFAEQPESLQGTLYLPKESGLPVPAVVVVHGGSWVRRSGDMVAISRQLAQHGIAAFNITYRSAVDHPYPAAVDDVRQAIDWLKRNAADHGIDPDRIGGWGYSAGGQLILRAGLIPEAGLSAIVSGGTPAQFSAWPESPIITRFIGQPFDRAQDRWQDASPVNHVHPQSPPVFLYHGAEDELVEPEQMQRMASALAANGVPHQTYLEHDLGHVGTYLFGGDAERQAIRFLQQWL